MLISPTPLVHLSRDFSKLYNNRSQADIVILTGTPDPTPFYAHSLILQCRSVYFDMVLADRSNIQRDNDGLIEFELPHVNKHAFAMLLRYFYSGTVDWVMGFKTETVPLSTKKSEPTSPSRKHRPLRRSSSNISTLQILSQNNPSLILSSDDESDGYFGDSQSDFSLTQSVFSMASSSSGESDVKLPFQSINIPKVKSTTDYDTQGDLLLDLLVAASELIVESLVTPLQHHIADKYQVYLKRHVFKVFELADTYDWSILRLRCTELLCLDPYAYFRTTGFSKMKKHLLVEILHRSDLRMDEYDIWCACLFWSYAHALDDKDDGNSQGISQWVPSTSRHHGQFERPNSPQPPRRSTPELPLYATDPSVSDDDNSSTWSDEQKNLVAQVKDYMTALVPCIRFPLIDGEKYIQHVEPYKVVPPYLRQKLLHHYILSKQASSLTLDNLPPRLSVPRESKLLDSRLISGYNKQIIDHWIAGDKSNNCSSLVESIVPRPSIAHPSYRQSLWKLLYSSNVHGPDMKSFHHKCDNQGPTITVIKIKVSDFTEDRPCSPYTDSTYSSVALSPSSVADPSLDLVLGKLQMTPEPSDAVPDAEPDSYVLSPSDDSGTTFSYQQKTSYDDEERDLGSKTQVDDISTALSQPQLYPEPTLHLLKRAHLHYAIHNHAAYGPIFGGGHDLFIGNPIDEATSFCRSYAFEGQIRSGNENDFAIEEMEVWSVRINQKCVFDSVE
ncbi:hypothetical protein K450DRAFT_244374 [Umbelopsis ramanniana AG]|uniref:BTB domain-containing protein n=1 Tax=Umbelopsis ramanniana AG TaxID=1314678 RepID=A0AAD5HCD5_UMBRA|nr:uncharacterized protein K450DRAFT_244374 [Umbelopsis ramanniana AG]KAI8578972.1 hypothetical protein K450DRAFT_244374 [Umbelopsis ramanniana AG]